MMLNPILRKEAQTSLRSWKIFAVIASYAGFIAFVAFMFIDILIKDSFYSGLDPQNITYLYALLSGLQFGLILITVPALTAGSISGEREKQTLDILVITKMTPFSIVWGKLVSNIGILLLMIFASMPVYAILFYFGGVSVIYLFGMTLFMTVTAFMIGAVSIYFSAIFKKTMISMVVVYLLTGFLVFGTFISYLVFISVYMNGIMNYGTFDYMPYVYGFLSINPGAGFFSVVDAQLGTNFLEELTLLRWNSSTGLTVPMWAVNTIVNIVLGFVFLRLSANKINPMKQ